MKTFLSFLLLLGATGSLQAQTTNWNQVLKAVASDRATLDYFGNSVAISGDYAVIGTPGHNIGFYDDMGAAYVFHLQGGVWSQQQKLTASDKAMGDNFGTAVAISGDYIIVSSPGQDSSATGQPVAFGAGAAYIFHRTDTTWTQQQKIVATDRTGNDFFGASVAISGNYAVVGADYQDSSATGLPVVDQAGAAYVFYRSGTTWTQQQKLVAPDRAEYDRIANTVSISGDYILIGARGHDSSAVAGGAVLEDAGATYVFNRSGTTWNFQQKLVASDRHDYDRFGASVGIFGDYALIGAVGNGYDASGGSLLPGAGAVYPFKRNGTIWSQQQKLVAFDRVSQDFFGNAISMSDSTAIIAAYGNDYNTTGGANTSGAGAAYIYNRNDTNWSLQNKVVASDRQTDDQFGTSVAISGNYAIVGAWQQDYGQLLSSSYLSQAGAAYFFNGGLPLAIQLANISAENQGSSNLILWNTATEERGDAFVLERSGDGIAFSPLEKVSAKGAASSYRHLDTQPFIGVSYYRLRFTGPSGRESLSKTVSAYVNGNLSIKVYPNPADKALTLELFGTTSTPAQITLYDITGRTILQQKILNIKTVLNVSEIPAGMYILHCEAATSSYHKTITVSR